MLMLILFIFCFILKISFEAELPICKAIKYDVVVNQFDKEWDPPLNTIYKYGFYMNVTSNNKNITYPNDIFITNFYEWSSNSSLYYRTTALQATFDIWQYSTYVTSCNLENDTCVFSSANRPLGFFFGFNFLNNTIFMRDMVNLFINDGVISEDYWNDSFFYPYSCETLGGYSYSAHPSLSANLTVCCVHFDTVSVPDSHENLCQEFQSRTRISNDLKETVLRFEGSYTVHPRYIYDDINITLKLLETPNTSFNIKLNNNFNSIIDCAHFYYNGPKVENMTCSTLFANNTELLFTFGLFFNGSRSIYAIVNVGEIIRRNGIYMKNVNEKYTPDDPCWTRSSAVPFSEATYETSFCCIKFNDETTIAPTKTSYITSKVTVSYSTVLSTISTTPSSSNPFSNLIGFPCSNDTTKAWLDIVFVVDMSAAMPSQKLKQMAAKISTYMETFSFGQIHNHTIRAGVIGYAKEVKIYFPLNATTTYDAFVNALFDLSNYANDSVESNLQRALQLAYDHLQTQKNYRKQVIVLIAAVYNNAGFQGADVTASIIKADLINIIVINYANHDGVLTPALQNISSPGYYYVSNQPDLHLSFPYALTQCNCFCPAGFLQFKMFNLVSKNYTNYADCFFGDSGFVAPALANRACTPGTLAAVTSQDKLNFITENVIPYIMVGQKKFTIGLHKSVHDEKEWKWWGYNETEYLYEDYPQMTQAPLSDDNYGFMWNNYGLNWNLQTGNNIPLPYICQLRACDSEYFCD